MTVEPGDGWRPASAVNPHRRPIELIGALGFVVAIHVTAAYALWTHRHFAADAATMTLQVDIIAPTVTPPRSPPTAEQRHPPPTSQREKPRQRPPPLQPLLSTPLRAAAAAVVAVAEPEPAVDPPAATTAPTLPAPRAPVALGSELSVVCHHRPAPAYPPLSRRIEETGEVLVRVELGEDGSVAAARIERGSGHQRLDEAALAAVRGWRCSVPPAFGRGARAVALQPFRFVLQ
ncbi:MAG: hypothetical protein AW08_02860 [Candidatus Accumulibacter adjunctus]|uniref:TonB C-terminal domain-containing protein n=1 Tax=Candidatus Accumulibacter adjunctus TaxID=1454001 RepID=A0A011NN11_9PROT|nr:MAG: hypothetical protein AW08_02860 [Candidatus Accumulibacter adjunctus]